MNDIYPQVRKALSTHLCAAGFRISEADVRCRSPYAEVAIVRSAQNAQPAGEDGIRALLTHPWVGDAKLRSGRLCVSLCAAFYLEQVSHMLSRYPLLPPALEDVCTASPGFSYMRARMYAKIHAKGQDAGPFDEPLRRALWLCTGTAEAGLTGSARGARLREAAGAVLQLGKGKTPQARQDYFAARGEAMHAIAWLLYEGIHHEEKDVSWRSNG